MKHQQESAMRSVRSTPRCPSASSPVQPGAERATTKVSVMSPCPRVHVSPCIHVSTSTLSQESGTTRASATAACPSASSRAQPSASRASATRSPPPAGVVDLVHHHNPTAGGEPAVREVRLLPRGAQLLLHPLLPGVHGPGQGQQVSQTGGMVTPSHGTSQPHDSLVSSVRSSRVTARAAARSAPPPAWRPPPGASVCPSASSTQATPSAAGS